MSIFNLKNKKVIITGAFGLIGSELSKELIRNNNKLILLDFNINKVQKIIFFSKKKEYQFLI